MSIKSLLFGSENDGPGNRSFDINRAEELTRSGKYHQAVIYIERHGKAASLSGSKEGLYYPIPKKYYDCVVQNLPAYIRTLPPEEIKDFILLVFSMMHRESKFDEHAHNKKSGARGLLQILPSTGKWVAKEFLGMSHYDLYNYQDNIKIGTAYLSYLIESSGGMDFMTLNMSCWNYGPGNTHQLMNSGGNKTLEKKIQRVRETRLFLANVRGNYRHYRGLYGGMVMTVAMAKAKYHGRIQPKPAIQHAVAQNKVKVKPVVVASASKPVIKPKAKPEIKYIVQTKGRYKVQVASFQDPALATRFKKKFSDENNLNDVHMVKAVINEDDWTRIQVWFDDEHKANKFLLWLKDNDHPNAWIAS